MSRFQSKESMLWLNHRNGGGTTILAIVAPVENVGTPPFQLETVNQLPGLPVERIQALWAIASALHAIATACKTIRTRRKDAVERAAMLPPF